MGGALNKRTYLQHTGKEGPETDIPEFSEKEKQIIRSTWEELCCRSSELCVDIFLRIFELRPDVKAFFPFSNAVGDALLKHSYFKGHATRFINAIKMTVMNLDAWEVILIPTLHQLGQGHTRIPGFTHDIFELFYYAMDDVFARYLGKAYNAETRCAWLKIFKFITSQVEHGYDEGMKMKEHRPDHNIDSQTGAPLESPSYNNEPCGPSDGGTHTHTSKTDTSQHGNGSAV